MRTVGRPQAQVELEVIGELTEADLEALELARPEGVPTVQRLRDSHHNLARALASGRRPGEAGFICGYSHSRVSVLQDDPAFQELVAQYRKDYHNGTLPEYQGQVEDAMAVLSLSTRMIRDRLEDAEAEGKPVPLPELRSNVVEFGDRLGFAKRTVNLNINANLADRLAAARLRAFGGDQREGPLAPASQGALPSPSISDGGLNPVLPDEKELSGSAPVADGPKKAEQCG
jgi:hypothetical protein